VVERLLQFLHGHHVGQVPFVELDDKGDGVKVVSLFRQVLAQVVETLYVSLHPLDLAVGHEDATVHTLEDQFPGGVVENLARNGVKVEPGFEPSDIAQGQG